VPITTALGVAGMPGVTAYFGLLEVGRPVAGETVVVSAASGAVGAVVGQLARMKGCRAVGTAGTAEKCAYVVDELQFDACVNYKSGDLSAALAAACPDGIDVYFDNVGGRVIDAVAAHLAIGARLSLCGAIAEYNDALDSEWTGPHLSRFIQARRATMRGFNQGEFADRHEEALALLATWVRSGALKYKEQVVVGLENAPAAFLGMLEGSNFGKLLVQVSDDPTR
jgi:NADPH-dependent curcumin reductase CurA